MSLSGNALTHAYIVRQEDSGDTASPFMLVLLSMLLCSAGAERPCGVCRDCDKVRRGIHPDVIIVSRPKDKTEIIVGQVRDISVDAVLLPNEAQRRVFVLQNAELLNLSAQNALLKLLEEPPAHVAFVLLTDTPSALLPTVQSRCRLVDGGGEAKDAPEHVLELAERFFGFAQQGGEALCEFAYELDKLDKADFPRFLTEVQRNVSARMRAELERGATPSPAMRDILRNVNDAKKLLGRNVSVMHIASLLCCG